MSSFHPTASPGSPAPAPRPTRWLSACAAVLWWCSLSLVAIIVGVSALFHGWIVPRLDTYRPQIERKLQKELGTPVRIGSIQANQHGWLPKLELKKVSVSDPQGHDALTLESVTVTTSAASLMRLGFDHLLIDGPSISAYRGKDGRIRVAGFDLDSVERSQIDADAAIDWLLAQGEVVIRAGTIHWVDELREAPPVTLSDVQWVMRRNGQWHQLRLDARPPERWGTAFTMSAEFRKPFFSFKSTNWRMWAGQAYASFPAVDMRHLGKHLSLPIDVAQGVGGMRVWAAWSQGRVQESTLDVALNDVFLTSRHQPADIHLKELTGRVSLQDSAQVLLLKTEGLRFVLPGGVRWSQGDVAVRLTDRHDAHRARGELEAGQVDLSALAKAAQMWPADQAWHQLLLRLQPEGLASRFSARWHGPLAAPKHYQASGFVQHLKLKASATDADGEPAAGVPWHPGVDNGSIDFTLNERGGSAKLGVARGALHLPGVFDNPAIAVDHFHTDLTWHAAGPQITLEASPFVWHHADIQAQGNLRWQTADPAQSRSRSRFPGILDLQGSIAHAQGSAIHRYLPKLVPKSARDYVRRAVVQAKLSQGRFKVKGDLADMPFADPSKGEFRIAAKVQDAVLDYAASHDTTNASAAWPALTQIDGELVFDRQSMQIKGARARLDGAPSVALEQVEASIANLMQQRMLLVTGKAAGDGADVLKFVNTSPVGKLMGQALSRASLVGATQVQLRLQLPLAALHESKVEGTLSLEGGGFELSPQSPALTQVSGKLLFTERGIRLQDVYAHALGGDVRIQGESLELSPANDTQFVLHAQGVATAQALTQLNGLGAIAPLASRIAGQAPYLLQIKVREGVPELSLSSNLQGLAINLPAPLTKNADATVPMRFERSLVTDPASSKHGKRDRIALQFGSVGELDYERDISMQPARVLRGNIRLGGLDGSTPAPVQSVGVGASIRMPQLDLDAWERVLREQAKPTDAALATADGSAGESPYWPDTIALNTGELILQGRSLSDLALRGTRQQGSWQVELDSQQASGRLEYRPSDHAQSGLIRARLRRLALAQSDASFVDAALNHKLAGIPTLDVVVDDLSLFGKSLGRLELQALDRDTGIQRAWQLTKLTLSVPEAQLQATGDWTPAEASKNGAAATEQRTTLQFKLALNNAGELLARLGQANTLGNGSGTLQGQISWLGAPWALHTSSLSGGVNVQLERGQFLQIEPGLGRLLGVVSLQSLPRRIILDFRDVFSQGFAFDSIRGDISIDQGIASTRQLRMKGVSAVVLLEGQANIIRETQDITAVVIPEINAGTASLLAATVNPVLGLGSFLAQWILRQPAMAAATRQFQITGPWTDPKVTRVARPTAADADAPAPNRP